MKFSFIATFTITPEGRDGVSVERRAVGAQIPSFGWRNEGRVSSKAGRRRLDGPGRGRLVLGPHDGRCRDRERAVVGRPASCQVPPAPVGVEPATLAGGFIRSPSVGVARAGSIADLVTLDCLPPDRRTQLKRGSLGDDGP